MPANSADRLWVACCRVFTWHRVACHGVKLPERETDSSYPFDVDQSSVFLGIWRLSSRTRLGNSKGSLDRPEGIIGETGHDSNSRKVILMPVLHR